jgi:hypothetical protein
MMEDRVTLRQTAGHFRNLARTCSDGYAALSYAQLADQIELQLPATDNRTLFNPDGLSGPSASQHG